MSRALVLSGGSIKGAFQAGAVRSVIEAGFLPEIMLGISTGALTASYLANELGGLPDGRPADEAAWQTASESFIDFYKTRITSPSLLVKKRSWLAIGWAVLRGKFDGFSDTEPLEKLIKDRLGTGARLAKSPVPIHVGAVNMGSGAIEYATQDDPDIVQRIYASSAMPFSMPLVRLRGGHYYDGGLRDIAPVGRAINQGGDEIVIIICQTRQLTDATFNPGNAIQLAGRVMDIVTNELMLTDLAEVRRKNSLLHELPGAAPLAKYKTIKWKLIGPTQEIPVKITDFTPSDIAEMIELGRSRARAVMAGDWEQ